MKLDRHESPEKARSPEDLKTLRLLEADKELNQMAVAALLIHESPKQNLRPDLRQSRMTQIDYANAARTVLAERRSVADALHQNALKAYQPQHIEGRGVFPSVVDQLETRRKVALEQGRPAPPKIEIPTFMGNERLEYAGMATLEDVARAGATLPEHREVLERGIPLQHQQSPNKTIGLPPGDFEHSQEDYAKMRAQTPFAGYALYTIVKD